MVLTFSRRRTNGIGRAWYQPDTGGLTMSSDTYEAAYTEALHVLNEKYGFVGTPYFRKEDGKRMCEVQSVLADDNTVFTLAWGRGVAAKIEQRLLEEPPLFKSASDRQDDNPSARSSSLLDSLGKVTYTPK
jgi:hypothetical protein